MELIEFKQLDPSFDEAMFLSKVNNVFIKLFSAMTMNKLEDVKHFMENNIYAYALQECMINDANSRRHMYDELNVKSSRIQSIEVKEDVYIINVYLQTRYMDYIIDLSNGNVISGDDTRRIEVNYLFTFTKKRDAMEQGITRKCPTCSAPLSVNTSGKCEYCGSIYNQEDYDWVLTQYEIC